MAVIAWSGVTRCQTPIFNEHAELGGGAIALAAMLEAPLIEHAVRAFDETVVVETSHVGRWLGAAINSSGGRRCRICGSAQSKPLGLDFGDNRHIQIDARLALWVIERVVQDEFEEVAR